MTKKELLELTNKLKSIKEVVSNQNYIINDYESKMNDIEFLKRRVDELGKLVQSESGDAYDPITWNEGDEVIAGLWYKTQSGYIWEAKSDGVPSSETDSDYFDIVGI